MPGCNATGANTRCVVQVTTSTGPITSTEPSRAAGKLREVNPWYGSGLAFLCLEFRYSQIKPCHYSCLQSLRDRPKMQKV